MVIAIGMTLFCLLRGTPALLGRLHATNERLRKARWLQGLLLAVAMLSSAAYFYGTRNAGIWLQRWDLFHTVISVRYFDELEYSRLYQCTYAFDQEGPGKFPRVPQMRDLRVDQVRSTSKVLVDNDCDARFTPARKQALTRDAGFFAEISGRSAWRRLFRDKGYNGTPFYTAVAGTLVGDGPLSLSKLYALASIDLLLLAGAFLAVWRAFGGETALVGLIFFCVNFPNNFAHMGASLLRFDYVAAVVGAAAALKLQRPALAAVLVSYGTFVRIYPGLFALGYLIKAVYDHRTTGQLGTPHKRFLLGLVGSGALFAAISLIPGGITAWHDWLDNMLVHTKISAGFRMGFQHLLMWQGNLMGKNGFVDFPEKAAFFNSIKPLYYLSVVVLFAPAYWLVRRLRAVDFSIYLLLTGFFMLFVATRYYYSLLVLGCFLLATKQPSEERAAATWRLRALLFGGTATAWVVSRFNHFDPFVYNTLCSAAMLVFVVGSSLILLRAPREA